MSGAGGGASNAAHFPCLSGAPQAPLLPAPISAFLICPAASRRKYAYVARQTDKKNA
jgi:hypothetical protein